MRAVWAAGILSVLLFGGAAGAAEGTTVTWSVINRNRILDGEPEEKRFLFTLNNYMARAARASACDPRRFSVDSPKNDADLASCRSGLRSRYTAPTNKQFSTMWSPTDHAYDGGYIRKDRDDETRGISLGVTVKSGRDWSRDRGVTCNWWIDDRQVGTAASCRNFFTTVGRGKHRLAVEAMRHGERFRRIPENDAQEIAVEDYVIAVLGDSFGSGEGNPHTFFAPRVEVDPPHRETRFLRNKPAMWLDPRCHRSLFSSSGIVAALLADRYRHASFSLATFACSGAETSEGLLDPYYGRETAGQLHKEWRWTDGNLQSAPPRERFKGYAPGNPPPVNDRQRPAPADIPSQLLQLKALLCEAGQPCRKPEIILIYIGVNDIGFTDIVTRLVTGCSADACERQVGQAIRNGLDVIAGNLAKLDAGLRTAGLMPDSPANVVLVTYPNPLTYQPVNRKPGQPKHPFCDWRKAQIAGGENFLGLAGTLLALGIREASARWANDRVLVPLNDMLRRSRQRFGWTVVDTENIALGHGFCARERWFQTFPESKDKQWLIPTDFARTAAGSVRQTGGVPTGAMHPNIFGHRNVAAEIIKNVEKLLDLERMR